MAIRIMIIDNNRMFREAIRHLLKRDSIFQVVAEVENVIQAIKIYEKYEVDIFLMNIDMANLNGIETVKLMLAKNKLLKIVALTSYQDEIYEKNIINLGVKAIIQKDNSFDQINSTIKELAD